MITNKMVEGDGCYMIHDIYWQRGKIRLYFIKSHRYMHIKLVKCRCNFNLRILIYILLPIQLMLVSEVLFNWCWCQ